MNKDTNQQDVSIEDGKDTKEAAPVTKKSIVIEMVSKKGGATAEEMAQKCTEAELGNYDRNLKTVKLWLPKIGFKVKKDATTGKWTKLK